MNSEDDLGEVILNQYMDDEDFAVQIAEEVSLPVTAATKLNLEFLNQDVKVRTGKSDQILVRLKGKVLRNEPREPIGQLLLIETSGDEIAVSVDQEKLTAFINKKTSSGFFKFNFNGEDIDVEVELPPSLAALRIKTVNGDGDLEHVNVEQLEFTSVSGDLEGEVKARWLNGETVSGDIELEIETPLVDGQLSSASGDIKLRMPQVHQTILDLKSLSGELKSPGPTAAKAKLTLQTNHGYISTE